MGKACFIVNTVRSNHRRCSVKKGVLRNSTKFTGKHLCHSLFFKKVPSKHLLVLKTCLEDVLKTCLEDILKTCLEDLLKILWRQTKYLLGISVYLSRDLTNLNVYVTSLYFTNLHLTTLKPIQNALITGDCLVL